MGNRTAIEQPKKCRLLCPRLGNEACPEHAQQNSGQGHDGEVLRGQQVQCSSDGTRLEQRMGPAVTLINCKLEMGRELATMDTID
jgi:hypothetical protein